KVLEGADKSFNMDVLLGPETSANQLITAARAYPTFASRRLIVVKEAHSLGKAHLDKIGAYIEQPLETTVVVFLYRKKKPDARTRFGKAALQKAVAFESKRLYDRSILSWIEEHVGAAGYSIEQEANLLLKEALGNNLALIDNELRKMYIHLRANEHSRIDKSLIYAFVNIDREFNVFELINYIASRDVERAHKTIHYLTLTRNSGAIGMLVQLYNYFSTLAMLRQQRLQSEQAICQALKIQPFFAKNFVTGVRQYDLRRIRANMSNILEADMQLKGVHNTRMSEAHVMKTLVYRLVQ
ncbi:MAG: DNA polymerase III subunit delta, partial [Sphingobacteriia bacterium]